MPTVPVTFVNRRGLRLFGILETPDAPVDHDLAVILLSPGVKMRLGPEGLYRRMSDDWVALGLPVLRFDFHGLGDSEGTLTEDLLRDFYNHIEVGRYVEDTIDAMNWMQEHQPGARRFILSGLCGGAITGLLAGARDGRVAGLIGLGITPVLAARSADAAKYVTQGQIEQYRQGYVRKLLEPSAWLRLLTFKSDYRMLWRVVSRRRRPAAPPPAEASTDPGDNANPLFPPAFFRMLDAGHPMLLVFGGSDRLHFEFEEKFVSRHVQRLAGREAGYQVHTIEHANHVLSFGEWQREMLDVSRRWITTHFARAVREPVSPSLAAAGAGAGTGSAR